MEIRLCTKCGKNEASCYKTKSGLKYHYCKPCKRLYANTWNNNNKEKVKISSKKTRDKHSASIRTRRSELRKLLRTEVLHHYSGGKMCCNCCGIDYVEFLAIDHINNNGAQAKREGEPKGGVGFYTFLRKNNYPEGFQVLCHNCNMAKSFYGGCPHAKEL